MIALVLWCIAIFVAFLLLMRLLFAIGNGVMWLCDTVIEFVRVLVTGRSW